MRAVIFDLDGTLLNCPYDFPAMREAVLALAAGYGLEREVLTGIGILEAIERGARLLPAETGRRFRTDAETAVFALEREGAKRSAPLPGAGDVLVWLKDNAYKVGIITRNSGRIVRPILENAGFPFDALLAREDVPRVKPDPVHIEDMLALLGVGPRDAIMVGDHIWDIACAKAAGLANIGITSGSSTKDALARAGADAILENISRLPFWLRENFALP